jgi:transposase-like protein
MKRNGNGDRKRGRRRSAGEWLEIARTVRASGLSVKDYAAREGLVRNTLAYWVSEYGRRERGVGNEKHVVDATSFLPVVVRDEPRAAVPSGRDACTLEVVVADVTLRFAADVEAARVAALVLAIREGAC